MSKSYADKVRAKMQKKAEDSSSASKGHPKEWSPDVGTHKIRILPPVGAKFPKDPLSSNNEDIFYNTFKFHWVPNSLDDLDSNKNGKYLWAPSKFDVDGKSVRCPICEAVDQWYSIGRAENDKSLTDMGGALKLKRHYFLNIILYTAEGPVHKVLVDRSNEGKLVKILCAAMGLPFFRDIEDNWLDKNSMEYDEDKEYYDLVDIEEGYDFKIIKEKTGNNPWDISYAKSFVMEKKSRALDADDLELMGERVDLKTHIDYETNFNVVKAILDNLLGDGITDDEEMDEDDKDDPAKKKSVVKSKTSKKVIEEVEDEDDESMDDMLDELDD